jgi:hypothetical protein
LVVLAPALTLGDKRLDVLDLEPKHGRAKASARQAPGAVPAEHSFNRNSETSRDLARSQERSPAHPPSPSPIPGEREISELSEIGPGKALNHADSAHSLLRAR